MPFNIGPGELLLVLAIALLVIGPGRLPDVGAALGKSIREFRKASMDVQDAVSVQPRAAEPRPVAAPAPEAAAPAPAPVAVPAANGGEPVQPA
jgi:TatA/E family protein of Tat protein translocase